MITDQQVKRLRVFMKREKTKVIAAIKTGMDAKTARKYIRLGKLPSEVKKAHDWQTRIDPFRNDWDEIKGMLDINNGLEGKTIFEYLQKKHIGKFHSGQLRNLLAGIKYGHSIIQQPYSCIHTVIYTVCWIGV